MEDKVKEIISGFIQVPVAQITADTFIDRTTVSNSITLHRMYAKLAEEGIVVDGYQGVRKFGDLLKKLNLNSNVPVQQVPENRAIAPDIGTSYYSDRQGIGIDIEDIAQMPKADDFREDDFYKSNFAPSEMAYCILQPDPYASFAGLFAAKEAIVKADNSFLDKAFSSIVIEREAAGKPFYPGFNLSVSHTNNLAIAVAIQFGTGHIVKSDGDTMVKQAPVRSMAIWWLSLIALLTSFIALYFSMRK